MLTIASLVIRNQRRYRHTLIWNAYQCIISHQEPGVQELQELSAELAEESGEDAGRE